MSKNIKICSLKILLATFILTSAFVVNKVNAMEEQPAILAQTDNGEEAVAPVEDENKFILNNYSKELENLKNNIQKNFNPTTCDIEKTREKIECNYKTFEELKAKINKLPLTKKEKNNLEISIKEINEKLENSKQNFQEFVQKYSNQIEVTEDMINKYLNKISNLVYKIENFTTKKDNIIFSGIRTCNAFYNLYNEFTELYCLYENKKLDFNKLIKVLKKLNIINNNIVEKFNNPEIYNNKTINPDKNSNNQLIENYFINSDLKNSLQKTLKQSNEIVMQKYLKIFYETPNKIKNSNIINLNPPKIFTLPKYYLEEYINDLNSIKDEIIRNMSDEKLNSLLTEKDKEQYLINQQRAITRIMFNLYLNPSDEVDSESVIEYFKHFGNKLFSANTKENILNNKTKLKIEETDKKYLKEKLKELQYSMDNVIEKFQQHIIKLDKESPYETYTIIFTIKTNYLTDILNNYSISKTKNITVKKENFKKILNIYKDILDLSCLLPNNDIDEKELNKHAKKLGIIKDLQEIKIKAKDLENIKNSFINITKKLKDAINIFCEKYKIDINKFKNLETNNYCEKYENEIAPPINNIKKESKNNKDNKDVYFKNQSHINNNVINIKEDNKINTDEYNNKISNFIDEIDITKINEKNYEKLKDLIKKYEQNQNNKNKTNIKIKNLVEIINDRISYIKEIKTDNSLYDIEDKNFKIKEISNLDKKIKSTIEYIENLYNDAYKKINNENYPEELFEKTTIEKIKLIIESTKAIKNKNFKYKPNFEFLKSKTNIEKYLCEIDNLIFDITNTCVSLPNSVISDVKIWLSNFKSLLEKILYINEKYKEIKTNA